MAHLREMNRPQSHLTLVHAARLFPVDHFSQYLEIEAILQHLMPFGPYNSDARHLVTTGARAGVFSVKLREML